MQRPAQRADDVDAPAALVLGCRNQRDDGDEGKQREPGGHPEGIAVVASGADVRSPVATRASPLPNARVPLTNAIAPGSLCGRTSSRRTDRASGKMAVAVPWRRVRG